MADPKTGADKFVPHILRLNPNLLEIKSQSGYTPLHLAICLRRMKMARALIAAGANQKCCDKAGNTLLHSVLTPHAYADDEQKYCVELLEMLDAEVRSELFVQRNGYAQGAATALHRWLSGIAPQELHSNRNTVDWFDTTTKNPPQNEEKKAATLKTWLHYSKGVELKMVNGAGETPLHTVVRARGVKLARAILRVDPHLLYRENAIGRIPMEIARDVVFNNALMIAPNVVQNDRYYYNSGPKIKSVLDRLEPEDTDPKADSDFLKDGEDDSEGTNNSGKNAARDKIWRLCRAAEKQFPGKRRLVSLVEANEVARRLAEQQKKQSRSERLKEWKAARRAEREAAERDDEDAKDEVEEWYGRANMWKEESDEVEVEVEVENSGSDDGDVEMSNAA